MRYKELVSKKLESLDITVNGITSLISQPNATREQFDNWFESVKAKIHEIQTLVNSEGQG